MTGRHTTDAIQELVANDDVRTMRGVEHDWVVRVPRADGPAPDIAQVWADHTASYTIELAETGPETAYYVNRA